MVRFLNPIDRMRHVNALVLFSILLGLALGCEEAGDQPVKPKERAEPAMLRTPTAKTSAKPKACRNFKTSSMT